MNILIFNWRDPKHPYAGGAERLSHEMAKRWVKSGHSVVHHSAFYPGAKEKEIINGVTYLRDGDWYNVHVKVFFKYVLGEIDKPDVIIDEVHGIPFFANLYARVPVVCLACEVAKNVWDEMYSFPINVIGKIVERVYLFLYKKVPFLTISDSTKNDLVKNGISTKNITVIPMGLTHTLPSKLPKKASAPRIIFLGRLAKSKGVKDAIEAFSLINNKLKTSKMWIVGKGDKSYEKSLTSLVEESNLSKTVEFKGFVSEKRKFYLLAQAHIILVPSVREGWGLIVPEANIVGTPAVVYDVPGLRDVTKTGVNGVVLEKNVPKELAEASLSLLNNKKKYQALSISSQKHASSMNWDDTAEVALRIIKNIVDSKRRKN